MDGKNLLYWALIAIAALAGMAALFGYLKQYPGISNEGAGKSGISGSVLIGPQCPNVRPDMQEQCKDKPYEADIAVKTEDITREVTRFRSDANGKFRVSLPPGTYLIDPVPGGPVYPRGAQQTVKVEAGKFTEITINYDTGIR